MFNTLEKSIYIIYLNFKTQTGLALEYTQGGDIKTKMIDLLDLSAE